MLSILSLPLALIITTITTPIVRHLGIIDKPNARKIHTVLIPRTGGIAIMAGFLAGVLCFANTPTSIRATVLLSIAWLTGLVDDIFELKPTAKLFFEIAVALAAIMLGFNFQLTGTFFDYLITFLWLIGYMNAFNLIDGLDGLASSVAIIQMAAILAIAFLTGSSSSVGLIALSLIGACLGFLFFNWHPARVFMGDSGSLFIGLTIALSGIIFQKALPTSSSWGGLFALLSITLYPIFDTLLSIYRRLKKRVGIFSPDRSHSYNLMVDFFGLKQPTVVCLIAGASMIVTGLAIGAFLLSAGKAVVVLIPVMGFFLGALITRKAGLVYVDESSCTGIGDQKTDPANALTVVHMTSAHAWDDVRIFWKECCSLAKEGFEVHLVAPGAQTGRLNQVYLHNSGARKGRLYRLLVLRRKTYQNALKINADIYHIHDPELIKYGKKLKKQGKRVFYDAHEDLPAQVMAKGYIPKFLRGVAAQWAQHLLRIADSFDGVVAVTPEVANRFADSGKVVVVRNFPLLSEFCSEKMTAYEERPNKVAYIGGLSAERGIKEIIKAVTRLRQKRAVELELAGNIWDSALEEEIRHSQGVAFHGYLNRSEIQQLLDNVRVGLVILHPTPNHLNSLPIKMFEYMAAGIPLIASDFPVWREIIMKHDCGLLVDSYDVQGIVNAMDFLFSNPKRALEIGSNGQKAIASELNWDSEFRQLLKLYR